MLKNLSKKILITMILICSMVFVSSIIVKADASWTTTSFTTTDLGYGVTLDKYIGTSKSTYNSLTNKDGRNQEITTANIAKDSPAFVVQWTKTSSVANNWMKFSLESIAKDYEEHNPGKKVLVATNNWLAATTSSNSGELDSVQISDGLNYRVSDKQGVDGSLFAGYYIPRPSFLGWDATGKKAYFTNDWNNGENYTDKLQLSFYNGSGQERTMLNIQVDKINQAPEDGEIAIYFANYDGGEQTFDDATIFKMRGMKLRYDNTPGSDFIERDAFAMGQFEEIVDKVNVDYNVCGYYSYHIVSRNEEFNKLDLKEKTLVAQYELLGDFKNVVGGTTFYFQVVRNGEAYPGSFGHWNEINCEVHPRTAFIIKEDGTFALSVIDGRRTGLREGMDYEDMANFYKTNYNAYNVFNYDGGGSSCMVVANQNGGFDIVTNPSDGRQRNVGTATLIVVDKEPYDVTQNTRDEDSITLEVNNIDPSVSKILATLGDETKEVVDGKVSFDNLESKTDYKVSFQYVQNSKQCIGSTFTASTCGTFATMSNFMVTKATQNSVTIDISVKDPAETFYKGLVEINGVTQSFRELENTLTFEGLKYLTEYECKIYIYSITGTVDDYIAEYVEKVETKKATYAHEIFVTASKTDLVIGETLRLEVTTDPVGITQAFTYTSSDESILTVNIIGKVEAIGEGTATITVSAKGGATKEITFTVTKEQPMQQQPDNQDNKKGCGCKKNSSNFIVQMLSLLSLIAIIFRKR